METEVVCLVDGTMPEKSEKAGMEDNIKTRGNIVTLDSSLIAGYMVRALNFTVTVNKAGAIDDRQVLRRLLEDVHSHVSMGLMDDAVEIFEQVTRQVRSFNTHGDLPDVAE